MRRCWAGLWPAVSLSLGAIGAIAVSVINSAAKKKARTGRAFLMHVFLAVATHQRSKAKLMIPTPSKPLQTAADFGGGHVA